ncbi:MAG TPA: glycosyltransferase family A protein [Prolixibacteraceae bacterium]|nr:glycosyltransferase family A protein [Prolixibacteraceae bacterium]
MNDFIYLIQGSADQIKRIINSRNWEHVRVLFLTYDREITNAVFFPNSTWGEGRNLLLKKALEIEQSYQYYIFLDDDIRFVRGSFSEFERCLKKYKPAVGVPVFIPKTQNSVFSTRFFKHRPPTFQICQYADAQFLALHRDLVLDNIVVPLQTQFDQISWWCTSSTQQLLLFNLYGRWFLQFNNIEVTNECHREYTNHPFQEIQNQWFQNQFLKPIVDRRSFAVNLTSYKNIQIKFKQQKLLLIVSLFLNFFKVVVMTHLYRPKQFYKLTKENIKKILKPGSKLSEQYHSRTIF